MTEIEVQPALVVRRVIKADPAAVFDAWTSPEHLVRWWGPPEVECTHAEVDLRVGGCFRLANLLPDGTTIWIAGVYRTIEAPNHIEHTWYTESDDARKPELVTVDFTATDHGTEVLVVHRRIASAEQRAGHEQGWVGCLEGLAALLDDGL